MLRCGWGLRLRLGAAVVWGAAGLSVLAQVAAGARASIAAPSSTLEITGRAGSAAVVQVNGRSYVDVESLARITGATLRFQGDRVVMSLPGGTAVTSVAAAPAQAATLSREFVTSAVGALSAVREWRAQLVYAVQHNQPVTDELLSPFRRGSEAQIAVATAAARNGADRDAATLMQNELGNLRTLSANYISLHDSASAIRTDALDDDPLAVKVSSCLSALGGVQVGAAFQDVTSCH